MFDTYLGMLYPTEDYKVYGYISNTRIKFILVVDELLQKEDEVRMVSFCILLISLPTLVSIMPTKSLTLPLTGLCIVLGFANVLLCRNGIMKQARSAKVQCTHIPNGACLVQLFRRFHTAFVDAVSNPFYTTSTVSGADSQLMYNTQQCA